jgi:hypothetical protein
MEHGRTRRERLRTCPYLGLGRVRAWIFPPLAEARKRWIARVGGEWDWLSAAQDWNNKSSILDSLIELGETGVTRTAGVQIFYIPKYT